MGVLGLSRQDSGVDVRERSERGNVKMAKLCERFVDRTYEEEKRDMMRMCQNPSRRVV